MSKHRGRGYEYNGHFNDQAGYRRQQFDEDFHQDCQEDFPAPSQQQRGRGSRGRQSRRGFQKSRATQFHERKGASEMLSIQEELKESLAPTLGSEEAALDQIERILLAITLSITTRGIGFGLCHVYFTAFGYSELQDVPDIRAIYRMGLGLIEGKLELQKREYPIVARHAEYVYPYRSTHGFLTAVQTVVQAPEPIQLIVNQIGYVEYDGRWFIPAMMRDREQDFIPRPENVLLSNLRRTVVALADEQTPCKKREQFYRRNPIPGCKWNDDFLLLNPDEIIPPDYNLDDDFREDIAKCTHLLAQLQKQVPKLAKGKIELKGRGSLSQLVSSNICNMKVPDLVPDERIMDYYRRLIPDGNVMGFYCNAKMSRVESYKGQLCLFGEFPDSENFQRPIYTARDPEASGYAYRLGFKAAAQIVYA